MSTTKLTTSPNIVALASNQAIPESIDEGSAKTAELNMTISRVPLPVVLELFIINSIDIAESQYSIQCL